MPDSEDGSSGGSEPELDAETIAYLDGAPLHARIGRFLDEHMSSLPPEVTTCLSEKGVQVVSARLLKTSFNATFLVGLDPPLMLQDFALKNVIVQVLGAELGDKPFQFNSEVEVGILTRSMELASSAGVRVPRVIGTGQCKTQIGKLDFIIEEFLETQTVEDTVIAPQPEWIRIYTEVRNALEGMPLNDVDTGPIPRFESLTSLVESLKKFAPFKDGRLGRALARFGESVVAVEKQANDSKIVLVHQDLNDGNMLCSKSQDASSWSLDGVIDWESAVVVDSRLMQNEVPWRTARAFALVVKGAYLADCFTRGELPRCELGQLVENYENALQELDVGGWLPHETWAARVQRYRVQVAPSPAP